MDTPVGPPFLGQLLDGIWSALAGLLRVILFPRHFVATINPTAESAATALSAIAFIFSASITAGSLVTSPLFQVENDWIWVNTSRGAVEHPLSLAFLAAVGFLLLAVIMAALAMVLVRFRRTSLADLRIAVLTLAVPISVSVTASEICALLTTAVARSPFFGIYEWIALTTVLFLVRIWVLLGVPIVIIATLGNISILRAAVAVVLTIVLSYTVFGRIAAAVPGDVPVQTGRARAARVYSELHSIVKDSPQLAIFEADTASKQFPDYLPFPFFAARHKLQLFLRDAFVLRDQSATLDERSLELLREKVIQQFDQLNESLDDMATTYADVPAFQLYSGEAYRWSWQCRKARVSLLTAYFHSASMPDERIDAGLTLRCMGEAPPDGFTRWLRAFPLDDSLGFIRLLLSNPVLSLKLWFAALNGDDKIVTGIEDRYEMLANLSNSVMTEQNPPCACDPSWERKMNARFGAKAANRVP